MPRALHVVSGFALLLLKVLQPSLAKAQEPDADVTCETITTRTTADILLADRAEPDAPVRAVHILPGETVCLQGELGGGAIGPLRLLERATVDDAIISLRLQRDERTTLIIWHGARNTLTFDVVALDAERKALATPAEVKSRGRFVHHETWGPDVGSVVVGNFFVAYSSSTLPEHLKPPSFRNAERRRALLTFGAWLGERWTDYGDLDAALVADGFAPLPRTRVFGGLEADAQLWRFRFGVSLGAGGASTRHSRTGELLSTRLSEIDIHAGYDLWRHRGFTVFATAGFSFGNLYVDSRSNGLMLWSDRIEPWEGDRVNFSHTLLPIELGAEYLVPFARSIANSSAYWTLQFGTRIGWRQQLGGQWMTDELNDSRDIGGGPDVSLSGPIARLVLGIGFYAAPPRQTLQWPPAR